MKAFFEKILFGGGIVFDLFKWLIFILVLGALCWRFLFSFFFVDGASMDPNLITRDFVILNKLVYISNDPARGDVVAVKYPGDPQQKKYVKRVIGLPGEKLKIYGGRVYINDVRLTEEYLPYGVVTEPNKEITLDNDKYYLMGDNRLGSSDSRVFGAVEKRFITGKAVAVLFPHLRGIKKAEY